MFNNKLFTSKEGSNRLLDSFLTLCVMLNKNLLSISIFLVKTKPWPFSHTRFTGLFGFNILLPLTVHIVLLVGNFNWLLLLDAQPVSTKYPFLIFFGFKRITFSLLFSSFLYFLKVISSIIAPSKDIDPTILSFSILTLLALSITSLRAIIFGVLGVSIDGDILSSIFSITVFSVAVFSITGGSKNVAQITKTKD